MVFAMKVRRLCCSRPSATRKRFVDEAVKAPQEGLPTNYSEPTRRLSCVRTNVRLPALSFATVRYRINANWNPVLPLPNAAGAFNIAILPSRRPAIPPSSVPPSRRPAIPHHPRARVHARIRNFAFILSRTRILTCYSLSPEPVTPPPHPTPSYAGFNCPCASRVARPRATSLRGALPGL